MKNIISETKNSVNGLNNRIEGPKERNSELENRITETTQSEKQKENTLEKKIEWSNRDLWTILKKNLTFMSLESHKKKKGWN